MKATIIKQDNTPEHNIDFTLKKMQIEVTDIFTPHAIGDVIVLNNGKWIIEDIDVIKTETMGLMLQKADLLLHLNILE